MGYIEPVRRNKRVRMDTVTPKKRSQRGRCQRQSTRKGKEEWLSLLKYMTHDVPPG
jgi:hypothetical protein